MIAVALIAVLSLGLVPTRLKVDDLVGCYQLSLGPWEPKLELGRDAIFVSMPDGIRLYADQGKDGFEKEGRILRALPGGNSGKGPPSFWRLKSENQVELIWTNGFTSVRAVLAREKSVLKGIAETHWDFPRQVQKRSVTATPVACAQP